MDWFQPNAGSITELSTTCIELVFLVYLCRLRNKTKDCYLVILIYLIAFPYQMSIVLTDSSPAPLAAMSATMIFMILHILTIIWCSYRFYSNTFPRESIISIILYTLLSGLVSFVWLRDVYVYDHLPLSHILALPVVNGSAVMLSTTNYLRKIRIFSAGKERFSLFRELFRPSTREIALFGGFALSLFLYILMELSIVALHLQIISLTIFYLTSYLLVVSIHTVVAFAYFNYAREETSFETKLVGITLFITLSIISIMPLILFGTDNTAATVRPIKAFLVIVPATTLTICYLLPLLFRSTILKHLNKIMAAVQVIISGNLNVNVDLEINDEIGRLAQNFNRMTASLRLRTEQLDSMRETIATDFHDQTGNMLSSITRQAGLLKLKLDREHELQPIIKSIVDNSSSLYASSKDFLWQLNHKSDDPNELFDYLTGYGQLYYNQFDIAFSANSILCSGSQLDPSAALNLIFIFKEAMTNVVKHAGATEVMLTMESNHYKVTFILQDNGSWKDADNTRDHYGLTNMERRCLKNHFGYALSKGAGGTQISITIPVHQLNQL